MSETPNSAPAAIDDYHDQHGGQRSGVAREEASADSGFGKALKTGGPEAHKQQRGYNGLENGGQQADVQKIEAGARLEAVAEAPAGPGFADADDDSAFAAASWASAYSAAAAAAAAMADVSHSQSFARQSGANGVPQQRQQPQQQQMARGSVQLRSLQSLRCLRSLSSRRRPEVWGWLSPAAGTKLPFVLLQGKGVALGRGRDAYHERLPQLLLSRSSSLSHPAPATDSGGSGAVNISRSRSRSLPEGPVAGPAGSGSGPTAAGSSAVQKDSAFVEIADGRVSRLHVWVKWDSARQQAVVEDFSSNGTFLNGERLGRGRAVPLADGDRISLVLSVAPLAEQAFIFKTGDPRGQEGEADWIEDAARTWQQPSLLPPRGSPTAGALARRHSSGLAGASTSGDAAPAAAQAAAAAVMASARNLARCQTNSYSTLQATTLDDLQCQICLSPLRDCVALQPCGHNYCAACLSHHLAALLASGQPLACPLRCVAPEQVVINPAVRQLLADGGRLLLQQLWQQQGQLTQEQHAQQQQQQQQQEQEHRAQQEQEKQQLEQIFWQPQQQQHSQRQLLRQLSPARLEPLPEGLGSSGSSASSLHSGSRPPNGLSTGSQQGTAAPQWGHCEQQEAGGGAEAAAEAEAVAAAKAEAEALTRAEAAAVAEAVDSGAAAAAPTVAAGDLQEGPAEVPSPSSASSSPAYRHVVLGGSFAGGSSMSSPPPSPFESVSARMGRFSSLRSEELATGDVDGALALPGAPTMPAGGGSGSRRGSGAASGAAAEVEGTTALPGALTMQAVRPIAGSNSSAACGQEAEAESVGGTSLPGAPTMQASQPLPVSGGLEQTSQGSAAAGAAAAGAAADAALPSSQGALRLSVGRTGGGTAASAAQAGGPWDEEDEEDVPMPMHPLCPLYDHLLPLDTAALKSKQLGRSLEELEAAEDEETAVSRLEALARLAWSDEEAREELGELHAVDAVVRSMREHLDSDGVQCNGCLALMALIRGEGAASEANRLAVAECGGVQVIAEGMYCHLDVPVVQLSALLCLVPLALENTYLQVTVARACLPAILAAAQAHAGEADVVGKALITLGVLGQGEEEAHEVIRQTIMERTPFPAITASVLRDLGSENEDVLWSALFALAVIAQDTSERYVAHLLTLASAGVLPALEGAMEAYRLAVQEQDTEPDEMILRAGDYLVAVLQTARKLLWLRRTRKLTRLALMGLAAVMALRWARRRMGPRGGGAGGGAGR